MNNTPKDFFSYLLSTIALYLFFSSLLVLSFKFINSHYPDSLEWSLSSNLASIRWHIAAIIIAFPVYIFSMIVIRKEYLRLPAHHDLKLRKWLGYFSLFLAAMMIMSDLGLLLYYFLNGDITQRFLLKVLVIFFYAAALFWFYLRELNYGWSKKQTQIWLGLVIAVVLATVAWGFQLSGSPLIARKQQLDQKRIADLTIIQNQVIQYWQRNKTLPVSLDQLSNSLTEFHAPKDPIKHTPYGYRMTSNYTFKLCASFMLPSSPSLLDNAPYSNWVHPRGVYCFQKTIDPRSL